MREWNRERLLRELDGDERMLSELVTILSGLLPAFRESLSRAVAADDAVSLARIGRKMNLALVHFGADGMGALAHEVERQARDEPHAPAFALATHLIARLDELALELRTQRESHLAARRSA